MVDKTEFDFEIGYGDKNYFDFLRNHDKHIQPEMLQKKIQDKEIIIIKISNKIIGWLRFSYFWDEHPFMNMLMIDEEYRGKGLGTKLVDFWEKEMNKSGYDLVFTSTLSNEHAQHFYRKLGYEDSGCLILEGEALEIILRKTLKKRCGSGVLPCTPSN